MDAQHKHNVGVKQISLIQNVPSTMIAADDSLNSTLEGLVNAPKIAVEIDPKGERYRVPSEIVLRVRLVQDHSKHLKVVAKKAGGQWYITLVTERGEVIRQYHYQYSEHPNPDGATVGRSHKHFPTKRHPLREGHVGIETWAYDPEPYPEDFLDAVKEFCKECNIVIEGLQERVGLRWFR